MSWPFFDRDYERGFERGFVRGAEFVDRRLYGDRRDNFYNGPGPFYNNYPALPAPVCNGYHRGGMEVLPAMVAIPRRGDYHPRWW
jgi:hypothetical protein